MLRKNLEDLHMNGDIGDWCVCDTKQGMVLFLRYPVPDNDWAHEHWPELKERGDIVNLPVSLSGQGVENGHQTWGWNGSHEAPTLMPSILIRGHDQEHRVIERWHGWLQDGKLVTA